jgi:iron complex outermembrane receptor protein
VSPGTVVSNLFAARKLDYAFTIDSDITELNLLSSNAHETYHQVSEELSVTSERTRVKWTGGVFLFREVDRFRNVSNFLASGLTSLLDPTVRTESGAAFGQTTVRLGPRLSGTVGIRYSRDDKTLDDAGGSTAGGSVLTSFQYHDASVGTASTPKFGLEFPIHRDTLAYGSITRGFKSGGFNISATTAGRGFAPEGAWTYETGVKSPLLGHRLLVNGAAYFTNYTDVQVQTPIRPGVIDTTNAATAIVRGVEMETQAQLARAWRAGGHVAWMDAHYERYLAVGPTGSPVDVAGRRLFNAPEWSGSTWLEYEKSIGRAGVLSGFLDFVRQSTVYFTPLNDAVQRQAPYARVNTTVTIRPRRSWSIGCYARNLTDARYITGASSVPPPAIGGRPGERRQVGIELSVTP